MKNFIKVFISINHIDTRYNCFFTTYIWVLFIHLSMVGSSHSMKVRKQRLTNYDCDAMMNDVNIVK